MRQQEVSTSPGGGPEDVVVGPARLDAVLTALRGGARGYLFAGSVPARVVPVAQPAPDRRTPHEVRVADAADRITWLTSREVEILQGVADGFGNEAIGHLLGISALTVKSHLARITKRLRARDRAHLTTLALRAGVIR